MPKHLSPMLIAAAATLLLTAAPAVAKLSQSILDTEQQACEQAAAGKLDAADAVCGCIVEGLDAALDDDGYAAMSRLMNEGQESPEGVAAREAARAVVSQCLAG